jgi:hypothetical protein
MCTVVLYFKYSPLLGDDFVQIAPFVHAGQAGYYLPQKREEIRLGEEKMQ